MILVDTSVWIDRVQRHPRSRLAFVFGEFDATSYEMVTT